MNRLTEGISNAPVYNVDPILYDPAPVTLFARYRTIL